MARNQHVSSIPPRRQWLEPDEAGSVAERWASAIAHGYVLSERVGRELLRWLGLVLVLLGFAACAPEPECRIEPNAAVTRAWCPSPVPVAVVVDHLSPCSLTTVQAAVDLWAGAAVELAVVPGVVPPKGRERDRTIYVTQGDLAAVNDDRAGNTHHYRIGRTMEWARIEVEDCSNVQVLGHELGHALGVAHSSDVRDLMSDPRYPESWDVPEALFHAYDVAQGLVSE